MQRVMDVQDDFRLNTQVGIHQQFIRLIDRARESVFDRQNAVFDLTREDRVEQIGQRRAGIAARTDRQNAGASACSEYAP